MAQGVVMMKVITPKQLRINGVLPELRSALDDEGYIDEGMLRKTVSNWKKRPHFRHKVDMSRDRMFVRSWTDDDIWNIINKGTRTYWITAKRKPYLVFRYPFKAKTSPRVFGSHAGFVGSNWASKRRVKHKTRARHWTDEVQKRRKLPFNKKVQKAISKALERNKR